MLARSAVDDKEIQINVVVLLIIKILPLPLLDRFLDFKEIYMR